MRYSEGVAKYCGEKKNNILNAVIGAADTSSDEKDKEDITMTTNTQTSEFGAVRVRGGAGWVAAAACALLLIGGGAAAYFGMNSPEPASQITPASNLSQAEEEPQKSQPEDTEEAESQPSDESEDTAVSQSSDIPAESAPQESEPDTDLSEETGGKAVTLNIDDHGAVTEGFEGLDIQLSELWYVPDAHEYGVAIEIKKTDGTPLDWDLYDRIDIIYNDLTPFMEATNAETLELSGGWEKEGEPGTLRFVVFSEPKGEMKDVDENAEIYFGFNTITVGGEEVASGNFEANFHFNTSDIADIQVME